LGLRETIWQRNYYEHIIRSENEYIRIVDYIRANPARWMSDSLYAFVKKA
jgi:REP element-mobilizing transposase RayT